MYNPDSLVCLPLLFLLSNSTLLCAIPIPSTHPPLFVMGIVALVDGTRNQGQEQERVEFSDIGRLMRRDAVNKIPMEYEIEEKIESKYGTSAPIPIPKK